MQQANEQRLLNSWQDAIISFLGDEDNYWCFFDGDALWVHKINAQSSKSFSDKFNSDMRKNLLDCLTLWGEYLTHVVSVSDLTALMQFKKASSIDASFGFVETLHDAEDNYLDIYYSVHWENYHLLKDTNSFSYIGTPDIAISKTILIKEALDYYSQVTQKLSKNPNEKAWLILSDEMLITYFILGEGDKMVSLAEETLPLCSVYNHIEGRKFREYLIDDNTGFGLKERQVVSNYHMENIWL